MYQTFEKTITHDSSAYKAFRIWLQVWLYPLRKYRDKKASILQKWWRRASGFAVLGMKINWRTKRDGFRPPNLLNLPPGWRPVHRRAAYGVRPVGYCQYRSPHFEREGCCSCSKTPKRFRDRHLRLKWAVDQIINSNWFNDPHRLQEFFNNLTPLYTKDCCVCSHPPVLSYYRWFLRPQWRKWIYHILADDNITPRVRMGLSIKVQNFLKLLGNKTTNLLLSSADIISTPQRNR